MDSAVGLDFYVQGSDGSLLASGEADSLGYIYTDTVSGANYLTITPPSPSSPTYLTLYNVDTQYSTYVGVSMTYFQV
jgi:hypothetical protein